MNGLSKVKLIFFYHKDNEDWILVSDFQIAEKYFFFNTWQNF